jgi:hypothetical protein
MSPSPSHLLFDTSKLPPNTLIINLLDGKLTTKLPRGSCKATYNCCSCSWSHCFQEELPNASSSSSRPMPRSVLRILKYLLELSINPQPPPPLPAIVPILKLMCTLGSADIPYPKEQNLRTLNTIEFLVTLTIA